MMSGAHRNAFAVENRRNVVRVHISHGKTHDSVGAIRRLHALDSVDFFELIPRADYSRLCLAVGAGACLALLILQSLLLRSWK